MLAGAAVSGHLLGLRLQAGWPRILRLDMEDIVLVRSKWEQDRDKVVWLLLEEFCSERVW